LPANPWVRCGLLPCTTLCALYLSTRAATHGIEYRAEKKAFLRRTSSEKQVILAWLNQEALDEKQKGIKPGFFNERPTQQDYLSSLQKLSNS
jgi:hypothetical protein